jgi:hypothetical protein
MAKEDEVEITFPEKDDRFTDGFNGRDEVSSGLPD